MSAVPDPVLSALDRLNGHARAWGCGKRAIYTYKTMAALALAQAGELVARPVIVVAFVSEERAAAERAAYEMAAQEAEMQPCARHRQRRGAERLPHSIAGHRAFNSRPLHPRHTGGRVMAERPIPSRLHPRSEAADG